ncbi:5492_t:CDS:2, partial [Paraglomus brasilianum]
PRCFSSDQQTTERKKSASQEAKEIIKKLKDIPVKEDIRTLPNFLTLTRLLISPVIGYLILNENYKVAFAAFCYAGFTDVLDGYIARHYNMRTMIGTIIDPAADKTLMTIMTVSLAAKGLLPTPLAIIILARDAGLVISSFYYRFISLPPPKTLLRYFDISISSAEVRPNLIGKVNTALQLALMGVTLCTPAFNLPITPGLTALQYTVAVTTIWSGFSYVFSKDVIRILKPPSDDSDDPVK